jgi:signal transduction histidine kinase
MSAHGSSPLSPRSSSAVRSAVLPLTAAVAAGAACAWAASRATAQDRPLVTVSGAAAAALLGLSVALLLSRLRLAGELRTRTEALRAESARNAAAYAEASRRMSADLESVQRAAREAEVRRRTAAEAEISLRAALKAETAKSAALEGETARLAEVTIPLAVERLRAGGSADAVLSRLPQPAGAAHRRLLDVALREIAASERLRAAGMAVCATAAGRAQALTTAMLADLREMENRHGEEVLGDLLHLDHCTAQAGRLADTIAVLTGARSGRRWTKPIVMESVLRGALGRIEAYQRVRLHSVSTSAVVGQAAEGVMHALAELMDNACTFSPPSEEVHVYVQETTSGVVVTIEDAGLGMPAAVLARAEQAVAADPAGGAGPGAGGAGAAGPAGAGGSGAAGAVGAAGSGAGGFGAGTAAAGGPAAASGAGSADPRLGALSGTRLGLAVVGSLARKHGLTVSFRPSSRGGTGVVVLIPPKLLTRTPHDFPLPETGADAGGAGRGAGGTGPEAGAGAGRLPVLPGSGYPNAAPGAYERAASHARPAQDVGGGTHVPPPHVPAPQPPGPYAAGPHAPDPYAAGAHAADPYAAGPHASEPYPPDRHTAGPYPSGGYAPDPYRQEPYGSAPGHASGADAYPPGAVVPTGLPSPLPRRPRGQTLGAAQHGDLGADPSDAFLDPDPAEEARATRARADAGSRFSAFREAATGGRAARHGEQRTERTEQAGQAGQADRAEGAGPTDRTDRTDRTGQSDRTPRAGRGERARAAADFGSGPEPGTPWQRQPAPDESTGGHRAGGRRTLEQPGPAARAASEGLEGHGGTGGGDGER